MSIVLESIIKMLPGYSEFRSNSSLGSLSQTSFKKIDLVEICRGPTKKGHVEL